MRRALAAPNGSVTRMPNRSNYIPLLERKILFQAFFMLMMSPPMFPRLMMLATPVAGPHAHLYVA